MSDGIVVIDGSLGTELVRLGHDCDSDPLWSARLLVTDPGSIKKVHTSYLEAGADVITTASYQASIEGFTKYSNTSVDNAIQLIKNSVIYARECIDQFWSQQDVRGTERKKPLVAGSVGPYGASQADGSEYNGNYVDHITVEQLINWHRPRVQHLLEAGCDLLAMETIPAEKEGIALMKLLQEFPDAKAWLSFSCQFPHATAHGEDVSKTFKVCLAEAPKGQIVAMGFNCCPPQYVETLLEDVASIKSDVPLLAYPNNGQKWIAGVGWSGSSTSHPLMSYLDTWESLGIQWIGGCCRTTPKDIHDIYQWRKLKLSQSKK